MRKTNWLAPYFAAVALVPLAVAQAHAGPITLDTTFPGRGWFRSSGQHVATNDNTFTGFGHASFYVWDVSSLPDIPIIGVVLRIGQAAINTQPPLIQINDVSTSRADLIVGYPPGSPAGQAIFNDLTTGGVYGTFATVGPTVPFNTLAQAPAIYTVPLNAQAVADLNAATPTGVFAIALEALTSGGAIFDQDPRIQQLILTPIPHFLCYEAEGDDVDVTVSLEDQFGVEPEVEVEEPELFCNPVDKNNEGIGDPTTHLTGYEIEDDDEEVERLVVVENQFGEQTLEVEEAELLFVPTQKLSVDGEPTGLQEREALDHFKCYEAEGDEVNVTVSLEDQFGAEPGVFVAEPEFFCNPVDKNGEGIFDPTAHLTCYEIEGDGEESEREVLVENQFGEQFLEVEEPKLLCVPSEKVEVFQLVDVDDDDDDD